MTTEPLKKSEILKILRIEGKLKHDTPKSMGYKNDGLEESLQFY